MIEIGDRVKLTEACLKGLNRNRLKRSVKRWQKRRGLVIGISKTSDQVSVRWDDRASLDYWPRQALERL